MSHRATNWAFQQRGLKPAAWRLLAMLADRHNPDYGCFPSQQQLAADTEMSRASLNDQLAILEEKGLIRRVRRIDESTRRQMSTRYILGFEDDFPQEPTPDSGHGNGPEPCPENGESRVQNLDSNPVIEPVTTTLRGGPDRSCEVACLEVCGPGLSESARKEIGATSEVIDGWIEEGFDLEADILPAVRERTARRRKTPIRTWAYFTEAIRAAHRKRLAKRTSDLPVESREEKPASIVDRAQRIADWIKSGSYVPPSVVSNSLRDELLARGLVDAETLRRLQIY